MTANLKPGTLARDGSQMSDLGAEPRLTLRPARGGHLRWGHDHEFWTQIPDIERVLQVW